MAIIWCGGEDIDFPVRSGHTITTNVAYYRSGYGRSAIQLGSVGAYIFAPLPSAVTNVWVSLRMHVVSATLSGLRMIELGSGAPMQSNVRLLISTSGGAFVLIKTSDGGGTATTLATSAVSYIAAVQHLVLNIQNYGVAGRVRLWVDGLIAIDYTGDVTDGGATSLDFIGVYNNTSTNMSISEMIVADEDVRTMSLVTHTPSAGDTTQWTGAATAGIRLGR